MPDNTYPVFDSGQTLTAPDLNLLRGFLHERDRLVGRMIGFGINAGLSGTVSGTTLTIAPGLAVDQVGEPLVLPAAQTIALPPTPVTPSYDFISGTTGFSIVLEASETIDPAPACGETDCAGHAEHHTRGVVLRVVRGRLSGPSFDFASDPLIVMGPIRLGVDSAPITPFNTLRNAIADRLDNAGGTPLIDPALILDLRSRSIAASDSPAIKGYKCGWLNMVLFATLDLLRTEALLALSWNRATARPGVVLGWVEQVGSTWFFRCGYRHAWEPPRGFTEAFLGGSCSDPAALYRERLEELIAGWAPPTPPPSGGGGPVDPPVLHCPSGSIRINGRCHHVFIPHEELIPDWDIGWVGPLDPRGPIWDPPFEEPDWLRDPGRLFGDDPIDFYGDGQIGGLQYVGQPGGDVQLVLEEFIGEDFADVRVVTHTEAQALDGYHPSSSFSPSDTIVLSVNQAGDIVATGRIAATRNSSRVATALPAAEAALAEAMDVADTLTGLTSDLQMSFDLLDAGVATLGENVQLLQTQFDGYRGGEFDQTGFGVRIGLLEQAVIDVGGLGQRISMLEGQVLQLDEINEQISGIKQQGERISKLEGQFGQLGKFDEQIAEFGDWGERVAKLEGQVGFFGKEMLSGRQVKGMSPAVGRSFGEFAETTVAAIRALEKSGTLSERYAKDVERKHAEFEVEVASGDPELIGGAAIGLMKSLRTMVKAAAKDTPEGATLGSQLDAQIRDIEAIYG